ncbi:MAG: DoxX family protein [Pyrinomonadaceae bacterium]|nr:DoxX family protein [Pyrinomonadaceae bacterium]
MTYALWIIQILLGLLFLFAGGSKLVMSIVMMQELARQSGQTPLPAMLLRLIGVAELLGGLGLILPGLLRIRPGLTPLAAAGLLIIMIGATVITLSSGPIAPALFPLIVCLLLLFVLYGRWRLAPIQPR